jgi:hypothetical protein
MKLDYECLKKLLQHTESHCDGFNSTDLTFNLEKSDEAKNAYHYKLAVEQNLIQGTITEEGAGKSENYGAFVTLGAGQTVSVEVSVSGLTMQGHQLLDAMRNDSIWKRIKDQSKMLGVEGLKQIPGLAIKLLLSSS